MDQFDAFKAMGEFWTRAGASFFSPQAAMPPGSGFGFGFGGFGQPDMAKWNEAQAALTQSWASANALSQTLAASLRGGGDGPDPTAGSVLARIFDPKAWLGGTSDFDASLTRMTEGPQLADLWQNERRFGALFTAWTAMRRAQAEHQAVMLDAWTRAAGDFARDANARADRGESFESGRAMMTLWIETANTVLLEVQRSEAFLTSQRNLLKASTELRLAQQDIATFAGEIYGLPTRAEIDDVHKNLTELKREVRSLRRARRLAARTAGSTAGDGSPESV